MNIKPFDAQTEAAASAKSSTEMATGIIADLRQHNYGNAERNVAILIAQLDQEEQEIRRATAMLAEIKPDAFMEALGEVIRDRNKTLSEGFKLGAFERQIGEFITNLTKEFDNPKSRESPDYEFMVGMRSAYRYALVVYQRTHK